MKFRHILFATMLAAGFAACSDDDNEPAPTWGEGITVKKEVALAAAAPQTLNIKAPAAPTLKSEAEWLHIGQPEAKSAGIYAVQLQADINPLGEPRTTEIEITAGQHKATVKLTQLAGDAVQILEITPGTTLDPQGGTVTIKYLATAEPSVTAPDWMAVEKGRAMTEGVVTLTYSGNYKDAPREAEVVLSITKSISASVVLQQANTSLPQEMGSTAKELAAKMYAGINIGNTMECPGKEGDWSMPVNEAYVAALARMGFNAVRIPCAWDSHVSDAATNTIDPAWLDRVDEVVGYVIGNGMYAIVNIHWDGGWLENTCKDGWNADVDKKQRDYWKQIAEKLNHYDEHLLLAAMNEPNHTSHTSTDAIMKYQQAMLDVVRATGDNNATRVLVMQVPNTNIDLGTQGYYKMPVDVVEDRLMVEAHFYDSYQFNMMAQDEGWGKCHWYWGEENFVAGSDRNATHTPDDVRRQMQKMKTAYVDKGIPAIIGEYCVCEDRSSYAGIDKAKHQASMKLWNRVTTREAKNAGCVPFFWETGGDINRIDGSVRRSYQLDGVFEGAAEGMYPF
ncbi:MAG: cellulase family glycosylhydrolase [Muribaculaceae bacterium]|nr:cellulase family glycosylhydrolase [Muribaculaceae bacterium]